MIMDRAVRKERRLCRKIFLKAIFGTIIIFSCQQGDPFPFSRFGHNMVCLS